MVSIVSKALASRGKRTGKLVELSMMGEDFESRKRRKDKGRKPNKGSVGFHEDNSNKLALGRVADRTGKFNTNLKHQSAPEAQTSIIRKQVDPEAAKYFSEIANLFESNEVDLEERPFICGNALEEAKGKEFELATDYVISHTLQTLLEGCDVTHLCGFLKSSANVFPAIAMDRSGSHVAETAIKSLAYHLQDGESHAAIEDGLTVICEVIAEDLVTLMCNCYGSHVLRSLLCLCKGVNPDNSEGSLNSSATVLAERLNFKAFIPKTDNTTSFQWGFPGLLKFLTSKMLQNASKDNMILQVDQYSSLVLQTALKLLAGKDEELSYVIPIILGFSGENVAEGNFLELTIREKVVTLLKGTSFSHLMEVVLEVAPEVLYDEMLEKIFRNSLSELAFDPCGNFVVQALISRARNQDQMYLIWEELGLYIKDLLEVGKSGVIGVLVATCQRLQIYGEKCCQALAAAVCSEDESPKCVVPRLLFVDSFFRLDNKSNWNWTNGVRMHVMGSLILQTVFQFRSEYIQPYILSITLMESDHVLEAAKDTRGARVLEAFLCSCASGKQKRRLIMKLRGNFGELSLQPSGSFTVEKCFSASNLSLREAIVSELLAVRSELSKSKQGPHLLRKLDVDGFAAQPDHWRSKQASKQSKYNAFLSVFASGDSRRTSKDSFLANSSKQKSYPEKIKKVKKEIDHRLVSGTPFLSMPCSKRKGKNVNQKGEKHIRISRENDFSNKERNNSNKRNKLESETSERQAVERSMKKRQRSDAFSEASKKKSRA